MCLPSDGSSSGLAATGKSVVSLVTTINSIIGERIGKGWKVMRAKCAAKRDKIVFFLWSDSLETSADHLGRDT